MTDSDTRMGEAADLLIELGCEELPPKALDKIRLSFFEGVINGLEKNNISLDRQSSRSWSSRNVPGADRCDPGPPRCRSRR